MTTPTQLPIPSNNLLDSRFNFEKLDQIVNSDANYYVDRFGKQRLTAAGLQNLINQIGSDFQNNIGLPDGFKYIGGAVSVEQLRLTPPLVEGQRILLKSYYEGGTTGGGIFIGHIGTVTDDQGWYIAGSGFYWERIPGTTVTPELFGAYANGVADDRIPIQRAIDHCGNNYDAGYGSLTVNIDKFYYVSLNSASLGVVGELAAGRTALCMRSGVTLTGSGELKLNALSGSSSGAIISNWNGPIKNVTIKGIRLNGGSDVYTGTGINCINILDSDNVQIIDVKAINSTAGGIYLRKALNDTYGCSNSKITGCLVNTAAYIGIQLQCPDHITVSQNIILNTVDNGIDIEGNLSTSTARGIARKIIVSQNNIDGCLVGVFMESCGDTLIDGNVISNFSSYGVMQNRINSASYNVDITNNRFIGLDAYSNAAICWKNNCGHSRVSNNTIANVNYAFYANKATYVDIGVNRLSNIAKGVLYVPNQASGFVYSRLAEQFIIEAQSSGVPFVWSASDYPGNNSTRYYRAKLSEPFFAASASSGEINFAYSTGTLPSNSGWAANNGFSLYNTVVTGETVVALNSSLSTAGNYIKIGSYYYLMYSTAASYTVVRRWDSATSTWLAGNYTADLNSALPYTMYRAAWAG